MESLYLLIPLSVLLVLGIGGLLAWSVMSGQFDELEREGERILEDDGRTPAAGTVATRGRDAERGAMRGDSDAADV